MMARRCGAVYRRCVHFCQAYFGDRGFLSRLCSHIFRPAQYLVLDMMRVCLIFPAWVRAASVRPSEFMTFLDHDVAFGLRFIPTEADYRNMERLPKERPHALSDGIIGGLSTTQEAELQRLVRQLRLSDGAPGPSLLR
ncbi:hypothetical protein CK203_031312 [Vitis vinifera]|uniref:Uncharacterized protein n=1 Tax=Vitis vinifera TaxID=29760 RepID=A0A438IXB7_VITVI|nr:hypothetical protein CK203_031312 [Vitis vinifera]